MRPVRPPAAPDAATKPLYLNAGLKLSFETPKAGAAHLTEQVTRSLRLQRERLLDFIDGVVVHIVQANAPEKAQRDDWNVVAMANQF